MRRTESSNGERGDANVRGPGDGYYRGFDAFLAQGEGVVLTFVGWLHLVVGITFYRDLRALWV